MRGIPVDGERVRALRRAAKLTQEQLAISSDCDARTIRNAERGANMDVSTLRSVANALDVDVSDLISTPLTSPEASEASIVRRWHDSFFGGHLNELCELYHPAAELTLPSGPTIRGCVAIHESFDFAIRNFQYQESQPASISVCAERVFLESDQVEITTKATGAKTSVSAVHVFEISASLILRHSSFYDSLPLKELSG